MKRSILFLVAFLVTGILGAQITVTDSTFPATGDTLRSAVDLTPSSIEITASGGPFDWDYSSLVVGLQNEAVFLDASDGSVVADLPAATHVVIEELTGTETYYRVTNEEVELLAANGSDPTGFGISTLFQFSPPILERRAPMDYPSNNMTESNLSISLAWADLPPILTDSLPVPFTPDSIRVRIINDRNDFVDAYGTLTIPGGSYEVLREKRTTFTDTRVEILLGFIGWQDVTDVLGDFGGGGLGQDTTYTYGFYSATEKEPIAVVTTDADDNPESVTFKDNGLLSSDRETIQNQPSVALMPNPVSTIVDFNFNHFPKGNYSVGIYGGFGQLVLDRLINLSGSSHRESLDLSPLASGQYFYFVRNEKGEPVTSGKLMKY
ncbi:MAG: T9SS type A sorting domain-containing protein [Bacteroidota bacterium]